MMLCIENGDLENQYISDSKEKNADVKDIQWN